MTTAEMIETVEASKMSDVYKGVLKEKIRRAAFSDPELCFAMKALQMRQRRENYGPKFAAWKQANNI